MISGSTGGDVVVEDELVDELDEDELDEDELDDVELDEDELDEDEDDVDGAEAVSYTHLDVYKRQPCRCSTPP